MSKAGIEILLSLATAICAGLLIGAEREQGDRRAVFAGIRTFPLFALAGAIGMLVNLWLLVALGIGVSSLAIAAYLKSSAAGRVRIGTSTEMAAIVTFGLGALCTARDLPLSNSDRLLLVSAGATAVMGLLSIKKPLGLFLQKISAEDVYATAKLLILASIVLPALPNRDLGPWDAINPRQIGYLVVMVSAVGFAGYLAIRLAGPMRGLELTGFFGGLASSTAVTLAFSGKAKFNPRLVNPCALAIVLASTTMFPRIILYTTAVAPDLAVQAILPFSAAALAGLICSWILRKKTIAVVSRRESNPPESLVFSNPFSMSRAIKFALLLSALSLMSHWAAFTFRDAGAYAAAFIGGTANVDATSLSIAKLQRAGILDERAAVDAIGIAVLSTTLVKAGLASVLGGGALGLRVGICLGASIVAGVLVRIVFLGI